MLHWRLAQRVAHTFHHMCEPKAHAIPKRVRDSPPFEGILRLAILCTIGPRIGRPWRAFCSCTLEIPRKDRSIRYIGRRDICIYNDEVCHAIPTSYIDPKSP